MALIICEYCGTEYEDTMPRCPLCGTINESQAEADPDDEILPVSKNTRRRTGARAQPSDDKIPRWLSVLICVVLGVAVVVGALYAMYSLGMLSPKKKADDSQATSLTLPIDDQQDQTDQSGQNADTSAAASGVSTPCTGIRVSPASVTMDAADASTALSVELTPADCTEKVTWSSSDPAVCTVDDNGNVSFVGGGKATVTASCGGFTATVAVECSAPAEPEQPEPAAQQTNDASLSLTDFTLFKTGEQAVIRVKDAPDGAAITWESSNTAVCTVNNGTVTAVKSGTATVTADVNGKKLECIVRCSIEGSVVATESNAEVAGGGGSLALDHKDVTLRKGEKFEISVVGGVSGGWNVSDSSVITVDGNGNVTALGSGTAKVYTVVGGQTLECIVRVS